MVINSLMSYLNIECISLGWLCVCLFLVWVHSNNYVNEAFVCRCECLSLENKIIYYRFRCHFASHSSLKVFSFPAPHIPCILLYKYIYLIIVIPIHSRHFLHGHTQILVPGYTPHACSSAWFLYTSQTLVVFRYLWLLTKCSLEMTRRAFR